MPQVRLSAGLIEYEDSAPGVDDGPVLLLCHGVPMTPRTQWAPVLPGLHPHRVVMPTLPMGGHLHPMARESDLTQFGMARLLGEFIETLDLRDVVLVLNDWGGGQFLLTERMPGHDRVAALALVACEAFDNFPPAPARPLASLAALPGAMLLLVTAMRVRRVRRARRGYAGMSRAGIPDEVLTGWFHPAQRDRRIRRDFAAFARGAPGPAVTTAATGRLAGFSGPVLIAWAAQDTMMPREHGARLAALMPHARFLEVEDSSTLMAYDKPELLTRLLLDLVEAARRPSS